MSDPLLGHNGGVPGIPVVSDTEDRCEVTDLIRANCAHCRPKAPAFRAQYEGTCPRCKGPIKVDDRIREREDGGYEHAGHR